MLPKADKRNLRLRYLVGDVNHAALEGANMLVRERQLALGPSDPHIITAMAVYCWLPNDRYLTQKRSISQSQCTACSALYCFSFGDSRP